METMLIKKSSILGVSIWLERMDARIASMLSEKSYAKATRP